jgi:hypothetical protein
MKRINKKDLELIVRVLNTTAGTAMEYFEEYEEEGKKRWRPRPGHYCLDWAMGHPSLEQLEERGSRTVLHRGSKKDLYHRINAFIAGMREGQQIHSEGYGKQPERG